MSLREIVVRYSEDPAGRRPVVVLPDADGLAGSLATADLAEGSESPESRVVIDHAGAGGDAEAVDRLAAELRHRDVGVLVSRTSPESLPVGPLVQAIGSHGLRVVQVQLLPKRHARTVLVLTADPEVPQRSYLLGEALPDTDAARLRQANEWALEGLQLRSLAATTEAALATAREELTALRTERESLETGLAAETKRLRAQVDSLTAANKRLQAAEQRRVGSRARRAARLLRDDPVGGSRRLARAAARRLGR